jgi:DNA-binding transcriptional LysR family regulator
VNLNDLHFFVQAVDSGGFAAAARRLGCPKSTVSKRVAELEARLGVQLIHRTSRSFTLTEVGRDYYDHARAAMIEVEAAENIVHRRLAEPSGLVRITASVPTTQFRLADRLPDLAREYPKLQIQLHVTDRFVDVLQEGFDVAIRSHFGPLPDSDLVQRRMSEEPFVLVAAPDYLALRGTPLTPHVLAEHDGLLGSVSSKIWRLNGGRGREVEVEPIPRFYADESAPLLKAAEAGLGIACLPRSFAEAALTRGRLVRVLPEWTAGTVTTTILTPHRRNQLPAVRAVIDFLCRPATTAQMARSTALEHTASDSRQS